MPGKGLKSQGDGEATSVATNQAGRTDTRRWLDDRPTYFRENLEDFFAHTNPPPNVEGLVSLWYSFSYLFKQLSTVTVGLTKSPSCGDLQNGLLALKDPPDTGKVHLDSTSITVVRKSRANGHPIRFRFTQPSNLATCWSLENYRWLMLELAFIYSETLVWSVLGKSGLHDYRKQVLKETTLKANQALQPLSGTTNSTHDKVGRPTVSAFAKFGKVVRITHERVRNATWREDLLTARVIQVIEAILASSQQKVPTASFIDSKIYQWALDPKRSATLDTLNWEADLSKDNYFPTDTKAHAQELGVTISRPASPGAASEASSEAPSLAWSAATSEGTSATSFTQPNIVEELEDRFTELFVRSENFLSLCETFLKTPGMSHSLFERNLDKLLLQLYRDLKRDAKTSEKRQVARFLRSQYKHLVQKMWRRIYSDLSPEDGPPLLNHLEHVVPRSEADQDENPLSEKEQMFYFTDSSDEEDTGNVEDVMDYSRLETIIFDSSAFDSLKDDFEVMVHPSLKTLTEKWIRRRSSGTKQKLSKPMVARLQKFADQLSDVQASDITSVSSCETLTFQDSIKSQVEMRLGEEWDWWPLEPPLLPLPPNQARIRWHCGCGNERWIDVPQTFAEDFNRWLKKIPNTTGVTNQSNGAQNQTLPSNRSTVDLASLSNTARLPSQPHSQGRGLSQPTNQSIHPSNIKPSTTFPLVRFIFLVVPFGISPGDLHMFAQKKIEVQTTNTAEFFLWLRSEYYKLKGSFRTWFGLSAFSHCDFYKFRKFDERQYSALREDYPPETNPHYFYNPRPMTYEPPIDRHEFNVRFNACYQPRPHLHGLFHRCRRPCSSNEVVLRIPQRDTHLEEGGDTFEEFWGIYARERTSFLRVLAYNIIMLLPAIVFFFLWLFALGHGDDLQGASVPVGVSLTAFTMFWGFIIVGSPAYAR